MSNFDGPFLIQYDKKASQVLQGDYWRVMKSYRFYLPPSHIANEWTVYQSNKWAFMPAGTLTDLGSVPVAFRGIINHAGAASQAFAMHDQLCEYLSITVRGRPQSITREEADLILRDMLIDLEIDKTSTKLIYDAVAAYQFVRQERDPSTTRLKRDLEAAFNFEDLQ